MDLARATSFVFETVFVRKFQVRDGFSTKMKVLCTSFFVPKKEKLGHVSGTTAAVWYPAVLSPGVVAFPGSPGRSSPPGFLFLCGCCSESEDSVI